jgi:hypothetical protein|tara:strand:+ start:390 stop:719 length:330 start_codon:yes stop_codon:yes gene_type:complete
MAKPRPLTEKEKAELQRIKEAQAKKNSTETPVTNVDTETLKREDPVARMKRATGQTGMKTMAKGGMAKGPMKKNMGGKVMAYKTGGGVRGSGKATKGTRACKMVTMKGS